LKEEAPDRTPWRIRFGRGCGPVVGRQWNEWWMTVRHDIQVGKVTANDPDGGSSLTETGI